ncbi:YbaB/EbfC family nucleoid-associated protein [Alkalicella caledoniensis]|uniref:Nucleoid-associated protein HYG86_09445 n=1 Tax=Alkalicella caledoniensis TaxID=2731377 RepID=A0A7G9W8H0_ALKCA|nr:YbaB/EbfC family nucleoid-associated protein [Alkalicella caledoniensis]QNO14982.1 YbaB/EbfC family nucleoid-associated protein [Alkalicella caledoniensis]
MFGGNMQKAMKQMQKMQSDMAKMQDELKDRLVEGSAGGGVVKAVVNGHKEVKEVIISPAAVDPEDVEMLQDLVVAAVNEALRTAEKMMEDEMKKITGGMKLPPGLF